MKKLFKLKDFKSGKIHVSDNVELPTESTRKMTAEGYLQATAAVTKVGIQFYSARDFGIDSDEPIGVLRPAETVFHPETIESLKMKPIVLLHPEQDVDSTNHARLSIGSVGETVEAIDSERLGASIQITDEAVVKKILEREIEELSLGYDVFIVSEEGNFNGQNYLYRMDGPMVNNHLAIVPEGRCGDTVKILDQTGGKTVTKKQMLKALRDAGVSEEKIKAFMKDAKDTDKGDFKEYTKLLLSGKDIDMGALIPAVVEQIMPKIEEMIAGESFIASLAKEVAAGMNAGPAAAAAGTEEDEEDPMTKEEVDAAISDGIQKRIVLVDSVRPFLKDKKDFDIFKATDREVIEEALKVVGFKAEDMKEKSDDYLQGQLDSVSKERIDAGSFSTNIDSKNQMISAPMTGIKARQALKTK